MSGPVKAFSQSTEETRLWTVKAALQVARHHVPLAVFQLYRYGRPSFQNRKSQASIVRDNRRLPHITAQPPLLTRLPRYTKDCCYHQAVTGPLARDAGGNGG